MSTSVAFIFTNLSSLIIQVMKVSTEGLCISHSLINTTCIVFLADSICRFMELCKDIQLSR